VSGRSLPQRVTVRKPRQPKVATPLEESTARQHALPDFEYIKARLSVVTIASDLGLEVTSRYKARCWRIANHRNGDADPSIGFQRPKNRWRCFVCDPRSLSNLDLVMMVNGMSVSEAARWIASRHPVPPLAKGKRLEPTRQRWNPQFRIGVSADPIRSAVVRSGLWADLSHAEAKVLGVFLEFRDPLTGEVEISYRGIQRFAHVGFASIASAVRRFTGMKLLEVVGQKHDGLVREVGKYRLSLDDADFQEQLLRMSSRQQVEIDTAKRVRATARKARKRVTRTSLTLHSPKRAVGGGAEASAVPSTGTTSLRSAKR
jgi:hypothetical protein